MQRRVVLAVLLVAGALALYAATLCPDLYWFDSAEFVNDAVLADIPHPPGYPLYNLLACAFTKVPAGTVAARVNALSAVNSALAIGALFLALCAFGVGEPVAAAATALLAVSKVFWEMSVVAEVYGLEILFIGLALCGIARVEAREKPSGAGEVAPLAVVCGCALFHRPTALFFLVGWIALLWRKLDRPFVFLGTMLVGALPYLHTAWVFFTRDHVAPGMSWSMNYFDFPRTVETFLRICTGTLYAGNVGLLSPGELAREMHGYAWLAMVQVTPVVVALAFIGLVRLVRSGKPVLARYAAWLWVANVGFFLFYNALEKDTMYVPSFVALVLLAVCAVEEFGARVVAVVLGALAIWSGVTGYHEVDRHDYHEVRRAVDGTTKLLPPRAWFYLTDDLIIHPFLHVMILEGARRDVRVQVVDGFGAAVQQGLAERIARREPVVSTLFYSEPVFRQVAAQYTLVPRGFLYELSKGPPGALPRMTGAPHTDRIAGAGVFPPEHRVRPSDQLQVAITWTMKGAADPAAVFRWKGLTWVHRIGYQGRPRTGDEMTEEYLLKFPWDMTERGAAPLTVAVIPSIRSGGVVVGSTADWKDDPFFKGDSGTFVRCVERGWPAYGEYLKLSGGQALPESAGLGEVEVEER